MEVMRTFCLRVVVLWVMTAIAPHLSAGENHPADTIRGFWPRVYMPLEMGISLAPDKCQKNAYYISTSLEFRIHRTYGLFAVIEYDEHTHDYRNNLVDGVNVTEGDVQYMDIMGGMGWRQPLITHRRKQLQKHPRWAATALMQAGTTWSQLKHVSAVDDTHYRTSDHNRWVPSAKLTLGIEYVFSPDFNLFLNVAYLAHLRRTQLETISRRGIIDLSVGFSCNLF